MRKADAVDMSPPAIARRLRRLAGLYRLARSLSRARVLGPIHTAGEDHNPSTGDRLRKLEQD